MSSNYDENRMDSDSVPITANLPVVFHKVSYMKWFDKNEDKYKFGLAFSFEHETTGSMLVHKVYQPTVRDYKKNFMDLYHKKREMASVLGEILNTLADKDAISEILELGQRSWDNFYTGYVSLISEYRMSGSKKGVNKTLYIKPLVKPIKDGVYTACLGERNFISLEPNMEYSVLEYNQVEDFVEDVDSMAPKGSVEKVANKILEENKPKVTNSSLGINVPF